MEISSIFLLQQSIVPHPSLLLVRLIDLLPWSQRNRDRRTIEEIREMESEYLSEEVVTAARARRSKER